MPISGHVVDIKDGILSVRRDIPETTSRMATVFLDRDGVLNRRIADGYVTRWEEFVVLPGVPTALRQLYSAGFRLVIVSNQAGVSKGLLSRDDLIRITIMSLRNFAEEGAEVDGAFFCLHRPGDECACRKPSPGLLRRAADFFATDFSRSFLIGDSRDDIVAGAAMACRTIYLSVPPDSSVPATYCASNLTEAARWIISQSLG